MKWRSKFYPGLYRFEITVKVSDDEKTLTLYRNIKTKPQGEMYLQALLDMVDAQGMKWTRAAWQLDPVNQ